MVTKYARDYPIKTPTSGVKLLGTDESGSTVNVPLSSIDREPDARRFGAVGDGKADDTAAIQRAADAGTLVIPRGRYRVTQTIRVSGSVLASPGAVLVGDADPLIEVGDDASNVALARLHLPRLQRATRVWGEDRGLVIHRLYSSEVFVPHVQGFGIGVLLSPLGGGCVYNRFLIGHLDNNRVNLRLDPGLTGWVNENQFHGGRYYHTGSETALAGTRQIEIRSGGSRPNNNLWLGGSLEGNVPEYHLDCAGVENLFLGLRWEASPPRVIWRSTALRNLIFRGNYAGSIQATTEAGATDNLIASSKRLVVKGSHSDGTALKSLLAGLAKLGLIVDQTTA